jgi:hypothetical protein
MGNCRTTLVGLSSTGRSGFGTWLRHDSWDSLARAKYRVAILYERTDFHQFGPLFLLVAKVEDRGRLDHEKPPVW